MSLPRQGHHPDINFDRVMRLCPRTKKIKGLHENDFIMASKTDRLLDRPDEFLDHKQSEAPIYTGGFESWWQCQRAETPSTIFEFGGPRVYSYEELLRAVAHQAGLAPRLIPIPLAVWHALAWASEMFPSPLLTRNQVELMQIDTVSSPEIPGFAELGISPHSVEAILQKMLSNCG